MISIQKVPLKPGLGPAYAPYFQANTGGKLMNINKLFRFGKQKCIVSLNAEVVLLYICNSVPRSRLPNPLFRLTGTLRINELPRRGGVSNSPLCPSKRIVRTIRCLPHHHPVTDFSAFNGPDVHVVLVEESDPGLKNNVPGQALQSIEVSELKGNEGDQEYRLPAHVDLARYDTVAIYCERFRTVFGMAKLEPF
jgi:hypothetical protein